MNNNQDQVEKSLIEIQEYLESMEKFSDNKNHIIMDDVSLGIAVQGQLEMIPISLNNDEELGKSGIKEVSQPELQKPVEAGANTKFQINWFNLKMIFIGTTALMFARINGKW